jgi:hypothetical protein
MQNLFISIFVTFLRARQKFRGGDPPLGRALVLSMKNKTKFTTNLNGNFSNKPIWRCIKEQNIKEKLKNYVVTSRYFAN